jgi:hypothetical protein
MRDIVPLSQLNTRAPEAGRIRMGVKAGKGMKSIDTFRFTSPQQHLIEQIARIYGGTVKPWSDPKARVRNQFEVITTSATIRVYVVPDGLSQWYEAWQGSGCIRRCDGIVCQVPQQTGPGTYEQTEVACLCRAQQVRLCAPYTRLTLLLPEIDFAGTWRLETKGWNAQAELPGMYAMIEQLGQEGKMVDASLTVEKREQMTPVGKRNFVVPKLSIDQSILAIQAGLATAGALTAAPAPTTLAPALPAAPKQHSDTPELAQSNVEDDIVDAEVISEEEIDAVMRLRADATYFGLDPERFIAAIRAAIDAQPTDSSTADRMLVASHKMRNNVVTPVGFHPDGRVQWTKP